jgi:hypothetical protein
MNITIGPPVSPTDFFDREEVLESLWVNLQSHSVLLAAPRRVGKSSLMLKLYLEPRPGFDVIWLDGQDYDAPEDLVADLGVKAAKLHGDVKGFFGTFFAAAAENIEQLEVWELKLKLRKQLSDSWRVQGESIVRKALQPDTKLLIIIDELPLLLHKMIKSGEAGKLAAQNLLDWLRHLRQAPEFFQQVRQIVGGSVGLARIASLIGSSHRINDLHPIELGALDPSKAKELATQLLASRNVTLNPLTMDAFLNQVGTPLPILIQILASVVASEVARRNLPADPGLVKECYEQRALGSEFRICFEDYYERLDRYYVPDEARVAKLLLRELAVAKTPLSRAALFDIYQAELGKAAETQFDLLLTWLFDDFYVEELAGGIVRFKSTWMRDWWRTYHGSKP